MSDWITLFLEETKEVRSPELFRLWGAISALSGAMERKVWTISNQRPVYPNIYTILVGLPASGKTEVTRRIRELWDNSPNLFVGSASMTRASFADELDKAKRGIISTGETFNSISVASNELQVLLPKYDLDFMGVLTDMYDGDGYSETRRGRKDAGREPIEIPKPNVVLLAACTADYLKTTLPEGAWEQGFMSRVFLIFSAKRMPIIVNIGEEQGEIKDNSQTPLQIALNEIVEVHGKFRWDKKTIELMRTWVESNLEPAPEHPRLESYRGRRYIHSVKLSMIAAMSEERELVVRPRHLERARDWMVRAETEMADVFKAMRSGGSANVMRDTWHHMYTLYMRRRAPIPESEVLAILAEQLPRSYEITQVLDIMVKTKLLSKGPTGYKPREKKNL